MKYRHKEKEEAIMGNVMGKIQMMRSFWKQKDWSCGGCGGQITVLSA